MELDSAPDWYLAELVSRANRATKQELRSRRETAISAIFRLAGWHCSRYLSRNLPKRRVCFRCSMPRTNQAVSYGVQRPEDLEESASSSDEEGRLELETLLRESVAAVPETRANESAEHGEKRRKRGGRKHRKLVPRHGLLRKRAWCRNYSRRCRRAAQVLPTSEPAGLRAAALFTSMLSGLFAFVSSAAWALSRRVRNRRAHALTGNGSLQAYACAAFLLPIFFSIQQGAVDLSVDTLDAVSSSSQAVVMEVGEAASRALRVASFGLQATTVAASCIGVWFVSTVLLNRLAHAVYGNTAPSGAAAARLRVELQTFDAATGEGSFKVMNLRTQQSYNTWVSKDTSACNCRAFLDDGVCGHAQASQGAYRKLCTSPGDEDETRAVRFAPSTSGRTGGAVAMRRGLAALSGAGPSSVPFTAFEV